MADSDLARFTARLHDYCGYSLQAIAIHSQDTQEITYIRDDLQSAGENPPEQVERWVTVPVVPGRLPRAMVTVYEDATTVHLSVGAFTVVSLVLDPMAAGRLNEFVDWCLSTLHADTQA